jgi:hypothetical protein
MAAQNPITELISVPIQTSINFEWDPEGETFAVTNIQSVLPFQLNDDWNLVARTIVPIVGNRQDRQDRLPGDEHSGSQLRQRREAGCRP